jgi:hypothetical protein
LLTLHHGPVGRKYQKLPPKLSIAIRLNRDLISAGNRRLITVQDLEGLKHLAKQDDAWKELTDDMVAAAIQEYHNEETERGRRNTTQLTPDNNTL